MAVMYPLALILGIVLVVLPTLVHLLARPRPVRLPYPTVRFLREAVKQRRALFRLRDILILLLRGLAVVLLAAAFARLFTRTDSAIALDGTQPTVRIVLLDVSQSMQARRAVAQVFDRAKAAAGGYVRYRSGLRANIIACAARAVPLFERVSENLAGLETALAAVEPRSEALDVQAALSAAAQMFAQSPGAGDVVRELVIISDFQVSSWKKAPLELVPAGVAVRFEQVGLTGGADNLAVCDVRAVARPRYGEPAQIAVEVGNFSAVRQSADVSVRIGDAAFRAKAECPPWQSGQAVVSLPADIAGAPGGPGNSAGGGDAPDAGWLCGTARLIDAKDVLAADDERPFAIPFVRRHRCVILSREDPSQVATSRYFLERALGGDEDTKILNPAHLDADLLAAADLVIIVQAGRLPADAIRLLVALTARGGSLLCVTETIRDVENLLALEAACGRQFRLPVAFSGDARTSGAPRKWRDIRTAERPFKILASNTDILGAIEFTGGVVTVARTGGAPDDVFASFDDGSAALIVTPCGRGRAAVLNADLAQSTLPASPLFVPLVCELVEQLTESESGRSSTAMVGQPVHVFLPVSSFGAEDTWVVGPPPGDDACGSLEDAQTGVVWTWQAVERAGIFRVFQGKRLVHALAAACPDFESDLRPADPETLKTGFGDAAKVEVHRVSTEGDEKEQRTEWWPWLMLSAVVCLLAELGLLKLFRS